MNAQAEAYLSGAFTTLPLVGRLLFVAIWTSPSEAAASVPGAELSCFLP